jgi:hypothetical protein
MNKMCPIWTITLFKFSVLSIQNRQKEVTATMRNPLQTAAVIPTENYRWN